MTESYKIRTSIPLTIPNNGGLGIGVGITKTEGGKTLIVTAAADNGARVYMANESGGFDLVQTCRGHKQPVSCVSILPASLKYPHGLIVTGSWDEDILGFTLEQPTPLFKLSGHKGAVLCIANMENDGIVTGSSDWTAKVWMNQNNTVTLTGHKGDIWSVAVASGTDMVLTGSEDCTIRMWDDGEEARKYEGHTTGVVAVKVIEYKTFLSASRDEVRLWHTFTAICLQIFNRHGDGISCVAVDVKRARILAGGRRTLKIWNGPNCSQTIHMPGNIISLDMLPNDDLVVGTIDRSVYVLTSSPDRYGNVGEQAKFEQDVAEARIEELETLRKKFIARLPSLGSLLVDGKEDNEWKMIRTCSGVSSYFWSTNKSEWIKICDGEVTAERVENNLQESEAVVLPVCAVEGEERSRADLLIENETLKIQLAEAQSEIGKLKKITCEPTSIGSMHQ